MKLGLGELPLLAQVGSVGHPHLQNHGFSRSHARVAQN